MATEPVPPSLQSYHPTVLETSIASYYFNQADTSSLGVLTGDQAVPFLSHANLSPNLLGEVWQLCDPENSGFLTELRFGVACRLIGLAQAAAKNSGGGEGGGGGEIKSEWIGMQGSFPIFEGYPLPSHLQAQIPVSLAQTTASRTAPSTPSRLISQSTGQKHDSLQNGTQGDIITAEEKARYATLFQTSGAKDGLLEGEAAQVIFVKSKLPFETLGKIWNLADTRSRGALDVTDFTIAMYLIQHTMNNTLPTLPPFLPPALYASALSLPVPTVTNTRGTTMLPSSPLRSSTTQFAPVTTLSPQGTGQSFNLSHLQQQQQQSSSLFTSPTPQYRSPPVQNAQWDISATEKVEADQYFVKLDPNRKGVVEGEMALPFMMASQLPVETLAIVWELADIRGQGALNRDEFAVAMRLIKDKSAGKDLPATLSFSMIPPSLRTGNQGQQQQQHDLLSLDDEDDLPLASLPTTATRLAPTDVILPQATGNSTFSNGQNYAPSTIFPQATGMSNRSATKSGTMTPQMTRYASQNTLPSLQPTSSTFIDDNDHADRMSELHASTLALESLQTEHASTTTSLSHLSAQREALESSLTSTTTLLNDIHLALSTARAAHESERALVDSLLVRSNEQSLLLSRARSELISAESDLSALRVSRAEIEGEFLRDKEEVRAMKKRLGEVEKETKAGREELEGIEKEAGRVRGLLVIGRKQVGSAEMERERVREALDEAKRELEREEQASPFDHKGSVGEEKEVVEEERPELTRTTTTRSTNPFDRFTSSTSTPPPPSLPSPTVELEPSSTLSTISALPIAVVGGAAALFGVVATKVFRSSEDEEKTQETIAGEADPFGVLKTKANADEVEGAGAKGGEEKPAFDDAFGDDFNARTTVVSPSEQAHEGVDSQGDSKVEEEEDSSDEEEGIEDATAAPVAARSHSVEKEQAPKSSSDSSSFVHVSSSSHVDLEPESEAAVNEEEVGTKFPPLEAIVEPKVEPLGHQDRIRTISSTVLSVSSPGSDMDTFEDAISGGGEDDVVPGASTMGGITVGKKRAAPPPPPSRSSLSTVPASTSTPSFDNLFTAATSSTLTGMKPAASTDDFDAAFDDFAATALPTATTTATAPNDFDNFDDEFDTPAYSSLPPSLPSSTLLSATTVTPGATAFDDSFADFDSAFDPPATASFVPVRANAIPFAPPPTTAREDDDSSIKDIVGMGFTRAQAIESLEKHNYDVTKAIDSLLEG